jgi:hypothetical protein
MQRAYLRGYRRAMQQARADLRDMARKWDDELAALPDDIGETVREVGRFQECLAALMSAVVATGSVAPQATLHHCGRS